MSTLKFATGTLLSLALFATSSVTWAQTSAVGTTATTTTPAHLHAGGILRDDLNLTPAQKEKIKAIDAGHKATIEEIKANGGLTDDQKKDAIKAEHQQMRQDITAVLTPAQNAKLAQLIAARKAQRKTVSPKKAKKLAAAQAATAQTGTAPAGTTGTGVTGTAPAQ